MNDFTPKPTDKGIEPKFDGEYNDETIKESCPECGSTNAWIPVNSLCLACYAGSLSLPTGRNTAQSDKEMTNFPFQLVYTRINNSSLDNNPSPGNKKGGLTTILEKSLGAVAKSGNSTMISVLDYASLYPSSIIEKNFSHEFKPNEIFKASDMMVDSLTQLLERERSKKPSQQF